MYLKYDNIYLFLLIYFQTLKDGVISQLFNRDEGSGVGVFFGDDEIEVYETVNNNLSSFTHSPNLPGQFSVSQGMINKFLFEVGKRCSKDIYGKQILFTNKINVS